MTVADAHAVQEQHRQAVSFVFRNSKHSRMHTVDAQPDSTRKFRTPPTHKVHVRTHRRGAADGGKGKSRNTHAKGVPDPVDAVRVARRRARSVVAPLVLAVRAAGA